MATVVELAAKGDIQRLDPQLDDDEQELRNIYLSESVAKFLAEILPGLASFHGTETSPIQDFDALASIYASGLPLEIDRQLKAFKRKSLDTIQGGIWYLKTNDLRLFGWFPVKDCFIAVVPDTFENVKTKDLYEGRRNEVIRFRNKLDLNEPKFIAGDDPDAVVSNYTFTR